MGKKSFANEPVDTSSAGAVWDSAKMYRNKSGYYFRRFLDHSRGKMCVRMQHILIWERVHGRTVPMNCCIHHRDENPTNNNPENLLCIPVVLHLELHAELRRARARLSDLEYAVDRQRITVRYEEKGTALIRFWSMIDGGE
jgi:hypothetical protein